VTRACYINRYIALIAATAVKSGISSSSTITIVINGCSMIKVLQQLFSVQLRTVADRSCDDDEGGHAQFSLSLLTPSQIQTSYHTPTDTFQNCAPQPSI
jgi:hypothetical protein